ncbi:hypothetical protein [Haliangium ochraceum]|uniref:Outer membrane protein beta-barrel domain-containing protein n=1 Tax=Haliangium ochraceum (strain DSM 14365 / JCM 11303 / SMP-2) TaxID=502025 RepID=D0LTB6_HALO1|nr:hypothetical protein [Haliangium ochraceum]ACY13811.1 hypothetical protein Hoch_1251 [Haliangium ochraceum DSM 14365]
MSRTRRTRAALLLGLVIAALSTAAPARADRAVYGTFGVGSSHPFRPGATTPATELGVRGALGDFDLAFLIHQEGGRMLYFQPTASVIRFAAAWRPRLLERSPNYAYLGGSAFAVLDGESRVGGSVELGYGWRSSIGKLGGFVQWQSPWYRSWTESAGTALRYGTTAGGELDTRWRMFMARVRAGLVGGTRPYIMATLGAGWQWR